MTDNLKLDMRRSQYLDEKEREISDNWLKKEIMRRNWYHRIDLGNDIITPGNPWNALWNHIRQLRNTINYKDKSVLDLGSWDGLWAFEAEALGASVVVASDCMNYWQMPWQQGLDNFLLLREALFSEIIPYWNVSPLNLQDSLKGILYSHQELKDGFDIVQHAGILYHLRDPMFSLAQTRSIMKDGGTLLLETAVHGKDDSCAMHFNLNSKTIYDDFTTWWAPTLSCLREMLKTSYFEIKQESVLSEMAGPDSPIYRAVITANAVPPQKGIQTRYNLDPIYEHGFGNHLIGRLPYNNPNSPDSLENYYQELGFSLKKKRIPNKTYHEIDM